MVNYYFLGLLSMPTATIVDITERKISIESAMYIIDEYSETAAPSDIPVINLRALLLSLNPQNCVSQSAVDGMMRIKQMIH